MLALLACSFHYKRESWSKIDAFLVPSPHKNRTAFNPLPPSDAVGKQKKNILEDPFGSVLLQFKKISPLWKPEI